MFTRPLSTEFSLKTMKKVFLIYLIRIKFKAHNCAGEQNDGEPRDYEFEFQTNQQSWEYKEK